MLPIGSLVQITSNSERIPSAARLNKKGVVVGYKMKDYKMQLNNGEICYIWHKDVTETD